MRDAPFTAANEIILVCLDGRNRSIYPYDAGYHYERPEKGNPNVSSYAACSPRDSCPDGRDLSRERRVEDGKHAEHDRAHREGQPDAALQRAGGDLGSRAVRVTPQSFDMRALELPNGRKETTRHLVSNPCARTISARPQLGDPRPAKDS